MDDYFTIGRLARAAGVNVETVRYYQRVGLLTEPPKPREGYRVYTREAVDRIKFIKQAKKLGFNLKEISELLDLGDGHCGDVRRKAEQKRDRIAAQIADLQRLRATLDTLINACASGKDPTHCPIVESLAGTK